MVDKLRRLARRTPPLLRGAAAALVLASGSCQQVNGCVGVTGSCLSLTVDGSGSGSGLRIVATVQGSGSAPSQRRCRSCLAMAAATCRSLPQRQFPRR